MDHGHALAGARQHVGHRLGGDEAPAGCRDGEGDVVPPAEVDRVGLRRLREIEGVADDAVDARMRARGDGGGGDARHRGEDAARLPEPGAFPGEAGEVRHALRRHEIGPEPVEDADDDLVGRRIGRAHAATFSACVFAFAASALVMAMHASTAYQ